jgi:thermitase
VESDYLATADEIPNDSRFNSQRVMVKIQAPQARGITHGDSSVKIAIQDTGIDPNHVDLASKIVAAKNLSTSRTTMIYWVMALMLPVSQQR